MGGSEKDSFESLRGMEPEMVSGSGRVEGTQPERVAFKSAGSEHTNIVKFRATARPTFILTPFKELSRIDNNYSDKEERLQFGSVPLVDPFDDQELAQL